MTGVAASYDFLTERRLLRSKLLVREFFAGVHVSDEKYAGCGSSIGNLKSHALTNSYYYFIFFLKVIASLKHVDFCIELEPY